MDTSCQSDRVSRRINAKPPLRYNCDSRYTEEANAMRYLAAIVLVLF